ncbi:methyl-accepting chemotaxis protein [Rhodoferax sp. TH121]|uniref:methyl-accepting chemotaxis protein n=1 Tax=Rhodoferax sp. TH121 TaxID=2022803 RepID=UPI0020CD6E4F|nr:methyl-accepting chemotaxis protein [Rhodoferax sp. TH121]
MSFVKFLYPGMWVMRKMRFGSKLAIVFLVALVPLFFIVEQLIARTVSDMRITRAEVMGVEVVEQTTDVIRNVQAHRGQTNMVLLGNAAATGARDQIRSKLADEVTELKRLVDSKDGIEAPPEWKELSGRLDTLVKELDGKDAPQAFGFHTALVEDLTRFVYGVADKSGLLYDPDPQTYLLMDMSVSRLISLREQIGRLRGTGAGFLSRPEMNDDAVGRVSLLANALSAWSKDVAYSQQILARVGFKDASGDEAQAAVAKFVALSKDRFKAGAPSGDSEGYFASGTQAIDAIGQYHKAVNQTMVSLLKEREKSLNRGLYLLIVGSVVATVLLIYLMLSFNISFLSDLRQVLRFMEETAAGNLRHKVQIRGKDELSDMSHAMDVMVNNISVMVASVRSNSALVANSGDVLVTGNEALSGRTEQQAANLEETSASVQELSSTVQDNANTAQKSDQAAQVLRGVAEQGAQGMVEAIASVEAIEASTKRMDEIVGVIDGLAFQTNILALNAAVEAARAGESGRGFAVVATEVRSLAQRSAASAKEIRQLIGASSAQVASGVAQIRAAGTNITRIVDGVRDVAANMSHISASSAEQSNSLAEITTAIRQLDEITQQNAAMVEQAVSQATALQERASVLSDAVSVFKLQQGSADEARALVERALSMRRSAGSRDAFVREVTPKESGLFDRDMYVFVLDRSGQYLAFGGNPAKVGTRVQDVAGIDGNALMASIIGQASVSPGWVEYDIVNPLNGKVQTKMSYVVQVDDVFVGCGVYKNLMASL